ncbi:hypothetical protein [Streptomyces sp. NRRL F-5126]|uniref:hypothetical protein n=1 Tax=Streptomyces sp. NRRL F-5126 TaxID=1463857 RepID=UPI00068E7B86|nr:hypothetical protein [Streptomyces sp. NRRL F-5126]
MTYVVTVDAQIPEGSTEMDPLQRTGAVALLEEGFASVDAIEGPDGLEVDLLDSIVAVYPGGALLKVFVDAPSLEFAEEAVGSVVGELLERSDLLSEWTVERCEVELHPELAKESLDAADGPDVPPDDPASRRELHAQPIQGQGPGAWTEEDQTAENAAMRVKLNSMADELKAFGPDMFGAVSEEDREEAEEDSFDLGVSAEAARLAAGAMVYGTHLLVDELFQDLQTLTQYKTTVAESERPFWLLEELPDRYALQYDSLFARRFLVTAIALTTRFTQGTFEQLSCVAEELLLRLLLRQAKVTLDLYGLLDPGTSSALDSFADQVYEDMDHEWLYDDAADGIDEDPAFAFLGIAPMGINSWFTPFNEGRYVHPYALDAQADPGEEDKAGE